MDPKAMALLVQYEWPGNVRELKNLIERLAIMVQEETITVREIPRPYNNTLKKSGDRVSELLSVNNWDQARRQFEQEFFRKKIEEAKGDLGAAAARAGVDQSMLPSGIKKK
jgi:two-component system nitrogen regulation response regulator NtrX